MDEAPMGTAPDARRSPAIGKLAAALAKAQKRMTTADKTSVNPHFKSRYADLASVWDACRVALTDNELAVLQPVSSDGTRVTITTVLVHSSGEWLSEALTLTALQNTPQAIGSTITYGRRYGLASMVGVAPDDDDGQAGSEREVAVPASELPPPKPAPVISAAQRRALVDAAQTAGWKNSEVATLLQTRFGLTDSKAIPVARYAAVLQALEAGVDGREGGDDAA
jgi:ERF superfamily